MVCGNCSKASGAQKCARCKMMTYCNRECQFAHWPAHKIRCKSIPLSPQNLQLQFTVGRGGAPVTFEEDMPAAFPAPDAPRELTSRWVSQLVDTREEAVLARHPDAVCLYCYKPAIKLQTTLSAILTSSPPMVTIDGGIQDPAFPGNRSDVYTVN
ncbi:hypothetical protein DFH07DRAFT_967143 [Mycena maculata]|uniref:MYND-type domain-containing protein n=1 Tax=Mycena maculata TaxID=230809 RepID=A0AAD7MWP5_9AGAR|nr:hypothetical protein DFH07DRAFT_967143 [Mycena maculata]